jgi:hypothetical protein
VARLDVTQVEGFEQLNAKLKTLNDRVKRSEVLKIFRRLARPVVKQYRANLPIDEGELRRGVGVKTLSARRSGGNPVISVLPGRRGKNDPFYRFMIVPKGTWLGSNKRGSRQGKNNVVPIARNRTLKAMENGLVDNSEKEVAKYVQKQINRLSK